MWVDARPHACTLRSSGTGTSCWLIHGERNLLFSLNLAASMYCMFRLKVKPACLHLVAVLAVKCVQASLHRNINKTHVSLGGMLILSYLDNKPINKFAPSPRNKMSNWRCRGAIGFFLNHLQSHKIFLVGEFCAKSFPFPHDIIVPDR